MEFLKERCNSRDSPVAVSCHLDKPKNERVITVKNSYAIGDVCQQIEKTCQKIGSLTMGTEQHENNSNELFLDTYEDMIFGELEHLQRLTLVLTQLVTQGEDGEPSALSEETVNEDDADGGSVFVEGELTSNIGDKTPEDEDKAE